MGTWLGCSHSSHTWIWTAFQTATDSPVPPLACLTQVDFSNGLQHPQIPPVGSWADSFLFACKIMLHISSNILGFSLSWEQVVSSNLTWVVLIKLCRTTKFQVSASGYILWLSAILPYMQYHMGHPVILTLHLHCKLSTKSLLLVFISKSCLLMDSISPAKLNCYYCCSR